MWVCTCSGFWQYSVYMTPNVSPELASYGWKSALLPLVSQYFQYLCLWIPSECLKPVYYTLKFFGPWIVFKRKRFDKDFISNNRIHVRSAVLSNFCKIFVSFSLFFKCTCDKGIIFSFFKIRLETLCTLYNFSTLNIALCVSILFTTTHFETLKLDQQVSLILSILPFFPIVLLPIISSDSSLKKSFAVTRRLLRDLPFSL